jgi:hypothetical protein
MRKKRALVLRVSRPSVAHSDNQFELLVLYAVHIAGRVYRKKRVVFSNEYVPVNTWIEVSFV